MRWLPPSAASLSALTPGVDVAVATNTTKAYIGRSAAVDASRDVAVRANAVDDILGGEPR